MILYGASEHASISTMNDVALFGVDYLYEQVLLVVMKGSTKGKEHLHVGGSQGIAHKNHSTCISQSLLCLQPQLLHVGIAVVLAPGWGDQNPFEIRTIVGT